MDQKLTPIESLDAVLKFMAGYWARGRSTDAELHKWFLKETSINMEPGDFVKVLERLVDDKYVKREIDDFFKGIGETPVLKNYYAITFDGEVFYESGGYKSKIELADSERKINNERLDNSERNARRLNNLTFWLALGSIGLTIVEIIKLIIGK